MRVVINQPHGLRRDLVFLSLLVVFAIMAVVLVLVPNVLG